MRLRAHEERCREVLEQIAEQRFGGLAKLGDRPIAIVDGPTRVNEIRLDLEQIGAAILGVEALDQQAQMARPAVVGERAEHLLAMFQRPHFNVVAVGRIAKTLGRSTTIGARIGIVHCNIVQLPVLDAGRHRQIDDPAADQRKQSAIASQTIAPTIRILLASRSDTADLNLSINPATLPHPATLKISHLQDRPPRRPTGTHVSPWMTDRETGLPLADGLPEMLRGPAQKSRPTASSMIFEK